MAGTKSGGGTLMLLEKSHSLLQFLTVGMLSHARQETVSQLGDRSQYIGMSDLGKAMECFRSTVADKAGLVEDIFPTDALSLNLQDIKQVLIKQITLQRGHWQEYGLEKAINATGVICIPQLEISIENKGVPIKAHLDFTIVRKAPNPAVRILELKSNEHIPEHLYGSYEAQVYGQIGLLHAFWDKACFSVPDSQGKDAIAKSTFPELVQNLFGYQLPDRPEDVDLQAWVVSISMSDIKPFGPYVYDETMLNACLAKAEQLWCEKERLISGEIALNDLGFAEGFHPLCDFCGVNDGCPKFEGWMISGDQHYDNALDQLAELKEQESAIKKMKKDLEQRIKRTYHAIGASGWLNGSNYRFKVSQIPGRKSIDNEVLQKTLSNRIKGMSVDTLIDGCMRKSQSHERLYVSKINKPMIQKA